MDKTSFNGDLRSDIRDLGTKLDYLSKSFQEFRNEQKSIIERMDGRVSDLEISLSSQREKISNWSIFQTALTAVVGAIATYLGVTLKK